MPAFAGYLDVSDYVDRQLRRLSIGRPRPLSRRGVSLSLGLSANYLHSLCNGDHHASPEAARAIAAFFLGAREDDPAVEAELHILRVLAGQESLPPDAEARALADKIQTLPAWARVIVAAQIDALGESRAEMEKALRKAMGRGK